MKCGMSRAFSAGVGYWVAQHPIPNTTTLFTDRCDTAGDLVNRGCGGRPPETFVFAPGSGGFAARTRCKTKCFLEGFALQTSHLSKPAVSRVLIQNIIPWGGLGAAKPPPDLHQKMPDQYTDQ